MFKKIITAVIAAAMISSSISAMAYNAEQMTDYGSIITKEISLFDNHVQAVTFEDTEEDALYSFVSQKIAELQTAGEICEVTVDGLSDFALKINMKDENTNNNIEKLNQIYMKLAQSYCIDEATAKCSKDYILEQLTFKIDNSMSPDKAVEIMAEKAEKRSKGVAFFTADEQFSEIPVALFINNSAEILSKYQFAHPELCYIPSSASISLGMSYSQNQKGDMKFTTKSAVCVTYLPITYTEFSAFQTKLQNIIDDCIDSQMNDAQKAMALQDWIIDNTSYGYALADELYPPTIDTNQNIVIYNIGDYDTLIELMNNKDMQLSRQYSHTAYAPAMLGYGVCQGYTMLYSALLDKADIENGTYISNVMNHQWSLVNIDDTWYHADITWNDPTPNETSAESYAEIGLSLTDGSNHTLKYQTENYHYYSNLFMSDDKCAENHTFDDSDIIIPDAECDDDKFHATENVDGKVYSSYAVQEAYYTKLNYCRKDNMYYYERPVISNGTPTVWYYKTPFKLLNDDGTYTLPTKIEKSEYDAALNNTIIENPDDFVTVQIPDDTVINNSINVECEVIGNEGDTLSIENIGTAVITITPNDNDNLQTAPTTVDAYLVYYGENNTVTDIIVKKVEIDENGKINFDAELPDGAVSAKIIILDADSELTPVIKAIGTAVSDTSNLTTE